MTSRSAPRIPRDRRFRQQVFKRDGGVCKQCQRFDAKFEVDHVVPLWSGGEDKIDNLQTLCRRCHLQKSIGETPVRAKTDRLRERHELTQSRRKVAEKPDV